MGRLETPAAERFEAAGVEGEVISDAQPPWLAVAGWESVESADGGLERSTVEAVGRLARTGEEHRMLWVVASAPAETEPEASEQREASEASERPRRSGPAASILPVCRGRRSCGGGRSTVAGPAVTAVTAGGRRHVAKRSKTARMDPHQLL